MPDSTDRPEAELTQRVETLEFRIAFQDDLLDTLNRQIAHQEDVIQHLGRALEQLREQVGQFGDDRADITDDVPPHY